MDMRKRSFPLIADDEVVISPTRQMHLYKNEELITNGGGNFHAKVCPVEAQQQERLVHDKEQVSQPKEPNYSEVAKKEAREDLRRKRQAIVTAQKKMSIKVPDLPASPKKSEKPQGLAKYSEKLRQSTYILADIKPVYQEHAKKIAQKPKKNNYDFLKRSQIYNQQENQLKKERQVAQELNLTRFEDLD